MFRDELHSLGKVIDDLFAGTGEPDCTGTLEEIILAWRQATFSAATNECLKRYYSFHLEGISIHSDTLSTFTGEHKALESGLLHLSETLVNRYGAYLEDDLRLPSLYTHAWRQLRLKEISALRPAILNASLPAGLKDCIGSYFDAYLQPGQACLYTLGAIRYFDKLTGELEKLDFSSPDIEQQVDVLFLHLDFNHLHHLALLQARISKNAEQMGQQEKLRYLLAERCRFGGLPVQTRYRYQADWPSLRSMLHNWLSEEIVRVREQSPACTTPIQKLGLNLSVAQLACLLKLLYDEGIFCTENFSDILRFFSAYFRSKRQENISYGSLSKESYSTGQVTAAVLRDKFAQMIKKIDRHFFPE
ncbi:hypothetical protein BEL04_08600 [Mucilaginibacter sp. PPCGB 2223]|uniref:hypothetical protein n=1 Tax=Mucilaginibacter sp. PPCGB 2223 TaxID=1886027 RepID=UPI0008245F4E|nr:hypothetical protein [Mucilaginibacter sp. PPCGB 2223]OCX54308.1 hypothetical protein BEL04_08600 [Mucilaginibacter sp. PPCGB 2223]